MIMVYTISVHKEYVERMKNHKMNYKISSKWKRFVIIIGKVLVLQWTRY